MNVRSNILRASTFSTAGILFGAALLPAGSAFAAASECGADAELVADGICEVTFTETPDSAWTPPAGITKIQALLVGGGGAVGGDNEYGGGGGDVQLVELSPSGNVAVTVGAGGTHSGSIPGTESAITQGGTTVTAEPGDNSSTDGLTGGDSGNGFQGDNYGSGAGAGGDATDGSAGEGLIVNEIDADIDLFADDSRCFGGGGIDVYSYRDGDNVAIQIQTESCNGENGGSVSMPESAADDGNGHWVYAGTNDQLSFTPIVENTGNGGSSLRGIHYIHQDGADGIVVLRYDVALAETGFDSTGAIAGGAALVAGGVALAVRRRRASN